MSNTSSLTTWLLTQKDRRQQNNNHHSKTQHVIYRLTSLPSWRIDVAAIRTFANGRTGKPRTLSWGRLVSGYLPEYADDVDKRWLMQLAEQQGQWKDNTIDAFLDEMLVHHRLYWQSFDTPLKRGRPLTILPHWQVNDDGSQELQWHADGTPIVWLPNSNFGVCPNTLTLHKLDVDGDIQALPRTLRIWPKETKRWYTRFVEWRLSPPLDLPVKPQTAQAPTAHLRCRSEKMYSGQTHHWVEPCFQYGNAFVAPNSDSEFIYARDTGCWRQYRRQVEAESKLLENACRVSWRVRTLLKGHHTLPTDEDWLDFVLTDVPLLTQMGWDIDMDDDFHFQVVHADVMDGWLDKHDDSADWFELNWHATVDGERLELLPLLMAQLDEVDKALSGVHRERPLLKLPDGRRLLIDPTWLHAMATLLRELFSHRRSRDKRIRLRRTELPYLLALEDKTRFRWHEAQSWRTLLMQLVGHSPLPEIQPSPDFQGKLRDYQLEGMRWMHQLAQERLGGILADDMGLGKTIQTIALLTRLSADGALTHPVLILAPTSVLYNWQRELSRFAPSLRVSVIHGSERESMWQAKADIIITSYQLVLRDWRYIQNKTFSLLVLDEAQMLKNPRAKTTQKVFSLNADRRFALTGTPIENHLGELWSLMNLVNPGYLGTQATFNKLFRQPIERQQDDERKQLLNARIAPFIKRRTKQQVERQLPPKTEMVQSIALYEEQQLLYETIRLAMHERVRATIQQQGLARSHLTVLDALLKLRQICCHPQLVKLPGVSLPKRSAKTDALMHMLSEMCDEGRRIIVFSQFAQMLSLLSQELMAHHMPHVLLTGQTRHRQACIDEFQTGAVQVFLISLKAGGTGLNLTAADTVIHYDPWWNPAVENQATDRAHRIGQDKPVFVYRLLCHGTVEEKIHQLQKKKAALFDSVLNQDRTKTSVKLSEEEIDWLFAPLV